MDLLLVFDVTCPESTPDSAPLEVQTVPSDLYTITRVTIVIPDGHAGLTGIALGYGGQPVIPYNAGAYISGNDEVIAYDLGEYPAGVAWSAFLCNNDLQSHSWETRWEMSILSQPTPTATPAPLTATDIYAAASTAPGGP